MGIPSHPLKRSGWVRSVTYINPPILIPQRSRKIAELPELGVASLAQYSVRQWTLLDVAEAYFFFCGIPSVTENRVA